MPDASLQRIGKYEIQAELGRGGFGRVYRAFDPTVGRLVAVKILTAEGDKALLTRFKNEAAAAGNLHHKNIVTIYEFGEHQGIPFLAMEFLDGEDLQQVIANRRPLTLLQKAGIMLQVADGLHCAHRNGVVHRDVKPANIRLLPDGTVKIMDFGIARLLRDSDATRLTRQGSVIGSLLYMAPEQITGGEIDGLCDIFAYGVTYYELLAGRHPFQATDPRTVFYKIANEEPEALRNFAPECPDALEQIVRRAMQKERDLRYQSLKDVLCDLEPILMELQQERAAALLVEANECYGQDRLDAAQGLLTEVLDLDPANRSARQLRERIQNQLQRRLLQPRIQALLSKGEAAVVARRFAEALEAFESALRLDRTDPVIQGRISDVREALDRTKRAARAVAEARNEFARQSLTTALEKVTDALDIDPKNTEAQQFLAAVHAEIEKREAERRLAERLREARQLLLLNSYAEAEAVLLALEPALLAREDVRELLSRVRAEKAAFQREQRLNAELASVNELLQQRRLGEAVQRAQRLKADFPNDRRAAELLAAAQQELRLRERAEAIERLGGEAPALAEARDYERALQLLDSGLNTYPGEPALLRLREVTATARAKWQREQAVRQALRRSEELTSAGRFEEALNVVADTLRQYPGDAGLLDTQQRVAKEWERRKRAEAIRRTIQEAGALLEHGQPERAVPLLEAAVAKFAGDAELNACLARACEALEARRRADAIAELALSVRTLLESRQYDRALQALDSGLAVYPGEAGLLELRGRAVAEKADHERRLAVEDASRRVRALWGEGRFDEALGLISTSLDALGEQPLLLALREQVSADWERRKRAEAIGRIASGARTLVEQGAALKAVERLQGAIREYGAEAELKVLLARAQEVVREQQRAEEVATLVGGAQDLLAQGLFDRAFEMLDGGLRRFPAEPALTQTRDAALSAQASWKRRQVIEKASREAERLCAEARFAEARRAVHGALDRYPDDPTLAELDQSIRRAWEAKQRTEAVAAIAAQANTALANKAFDRASQVLEEGLRRFPAEGELARLRETVRAAKTIDTAIREAEPLLAAGRFEHALSTVAAALHRYPDDPALAALEQRIRDAQGVAEVAARADKALAGKMFDDAVQILDDGLRQFPSQSDLMILRERALTGQAVHEAEQLLAEGRFDDALARAASALSKNPYESFLRDLDRRIRVARAVAEITARANGALASGEFDRALQILDDGLRQFPSAREPAQLRERVRARQASADVEQLLAEGRLDEALRAVTAALGRHPGESALADLERRIRRAGAVAAIASEAKTASARREFASALQVLDEGLRRFPSEAALIELRASTLDAQAVDVAGREAERLLAESRFEEALRTLADALEAHPGEQVLTNLERRVLDAQAVASIADEAKHALANKALDGALEILDEGLRRYPANPVLANLRTIALSARAVEVAIRDAERLGAEGRYEEALRTVAEALVDYPAEPSLTDLERRLREAEALVAVTTRANHALASREFDRALEELENGMRRFPSESSLRKLQEAALSGKAAHEREQAIRNAAGYAKNLLAGGRFEEALGTVRDALGRYPDEPVLAELERRIRDAEAIAEIAARANDALAGKAFDRALQVLDDGLRQFPTESELTRLRETAVAGQAAEDLLEQKRFEDALRTTRAIRSRYPDEPMLSDLEQRIREAEALASFASQANDALASKAYDRALKVLDDGFRRFPAESELTKLREAALAGLAVEKAAREAEGLLAAGRYQEALRKVQGRPVLSDLERRIRDAEALAAITAQAKDALASKAYDRALKVLEDGLRRFPAESELTKLREAALAGLAVEKAAREALAAITAQAKDALASKAYDRALKVVDDGLRRFPAESELTKLREAALAGLAVEKAAREALAAIAAQAKDALASKAYDRALKVVDEGLRRFPAESELTKLREAALAGLAVEKAAREAEGLAARGRFEEALRRVEAAIKKNGAEPTLAALQTKLQTEWDLKKRTDSVRGAVRDADALLQRGEAAGAVAALEAAAAQYPGETAISDALARSREVLESQQEAEAVERLCSETRVYLQTENFQTAIQVLDDGLKTYVGDVALTGLRDLAVTRQAVWERERRIFEARNQCEEPASAGRYEDALRNVEALLEEVPGEPALTELRRRLQEKWELQKRAEVRRVLDEAARLLDSGQAEAAVGLLTTAAAERPQDAEIASMLAGAEQALRARQTLEDVDKLCRETRVYVESKDFDRAIDLLDRGLKTYTAETRLEVLRSTVISAKSAWIEGRAAHTLEYPAAPEAIRLFQPPVIEQITEAPAAPAEPVPEAPPQPPGPSRRPGISRRVAAGAGVAAVAAVGLLFSVFRRADSRFLPLEIATVPTGAQVVINGKVCTTPDCNLKFSRGTYPVEVRKEGYEPRHLTAVIGPGGPRRIDANLMPLKSVLQVTSNLGPARVTLDRKEAGELRDGEFQVRDLEPGEHSLRLSGGGVPTVLSFETATARPPVLKATGATDSARALVVSTFGGAAVITCPGCAGAADIDSHDAGRFTNGSLTLQGLALGSHELKLTGADERTVIFHSGNAPSLNVFLTSAGAPGTLVVETGEDGVAVFVNGRRYSRETSQGRLRIPLPAKDYTVRVEKSGYQSEPATVPVAMRNGAEVRAEFRLTPDDATLRIAGSIPQTRIVVDGVPTGTVGPDGRLSTKVRPGDRAVELLKDGFLSKTIRRKFPPGSLITLGQSEVQLAEAAAPPRTEKVPPVRPEPPPPAPPDPRVIETQDWDRLRNSRNPAELHDFLRKYPNGPYSEQAGAKLDELDWTSVNKNERASLEGYLAKHPAGAFAQTAEEAAAALDRQAGDDARLHRQEQQLKTEREQIAAVLRKYSDAYGRKDADEVAVLRPGLQGKALKELRDSFKTFRSMHLDLQVTEEPQVTGDAATVSCLRTTEAVDDRGPHTSRSKAIVTLVKSNGRWVIDSIR